MTSLSLYDNGLETLMSTIDPKFYSNLEFEESIKKEKEFIEKYKLGVVRVEAKEEGNMHVYFSDNFNGHSHIFYRADEGRRVGFSWKSYSEYEGDAYVGDRYEINYFEPPVVEVECPPFMTIGKSLFYMSLKEGDDLNKYLKEFKEAVFSNVREKIKYLEKCVGRINEEEEEKREKAKRQVEETIRRQKRSIELTERYKGIEE